MKRAGTTLICFLFASLFATAVHAVVNDAPVPADSPDNGSAPYSAIWLRNVFDLKPAPPINPADSKTNAPPPNVKLTGIDTIFGHKQALFILQQGQGKGPGKEQSYILSEGERQGPLEVVSIDPKSCMVKIKLDGTESTITFDTTKPAAAGGPAGQVAGGPQPIQRGVGQRPGGTAGGIPIPISRPVRSADNQQTGGGYSPGYAQNNNNYVQPAYQGGFQGGYTPPATATAAAPTSGVNLGSMFTQPGSAQETQAPQPTGPVLSAEEQVLNGMVQQVQNKDAINSGVFPRLPTPPGVENPLTGEVAPPVPEEAPPVPGQQ